MNKNLKAWIDHANKLVSELPEEEQRKMRRDAMIDFAYANLTCTGRRSNIKREMLEAQWDLLYGDKP